LRAFFIGIKADLEVQMVIPFYKKQRKGGVKVIEVEDGREEEEEVLVRHEIVSSKWKRWNHDTFSRDWNEKYSV
jgi:hypothetical protein